MQRTYICLLALCFALFTTQVSAAPTGGADARETNAVGEAPIAGPVQDAGLWLLIGGAGIAVVGAGVAVGVDASLPKAANQIPEDFDYETRQQLRTLGATSALIAVVGGVVALTGAAMMVWPEE
jgi:hypothetical protein